MEQYDLTSRRICEQITKNYSTSFTMASRRFDKKVRPHIYAIYGLTRVADEIVDAYKGENADKLLDNMEQEVYLTLKRRYSANPVVHAFCLTAVEYGIDRAVIEAFFASMRTDLTKKNFNQKEYEQYIYGSAEAVGLMCLRVFCSGDDGLYKSLQSGARRLGAAYQKVNFLRDIAADYNDLGRYYFPIGSFAKFDETTKQKIIADIRKDFKIAKTYINQLPKSAQKAVAMSYRYYLGLLDKLESTPAEVIKKERVRISNLHKIALFGLPTKRLVK